MIGPQIVTWAPGIVSPKAPVFSNWFDVEKIVNDLQGNAIVMVDMTGLPVGSFAPLPAAANLDGQGRLAIIGAGPRGEVQIETGDGSVLKNVREWRTIVVRSTPTIRSPIQYDINGLVVEGFDATFQFGGPTATLPVIQMADFPAPGGYIAMLLYMSSQFRNSHNPGKAVLDLGTTVGNTLLLGVAANVFGANFVDTISGPAGTIVSMEVDSTLVPPTFSQFFGTLTVTQDSVAAGTAYTPAVPANWSGTPPTTVQQALDRIAAAIGPIP